MNGKRWCCLWACTIMGLASVGCTNLKTEPKRETPLLVTLRETFDLPEVSDNWSFRTPGLWHVASEGDRRFLQMNEPPKRPMLPGVRRPQEYAIYNKYEFRSFNLSCRVRVDCDPSVRGRDVVIIFGRQDKTHYYYIHLSNRSDTVHNMLIRVDGDTRQPLLPAGSLPLTLTDNAWHKVDIQRDVEKGTITVYFDYDAGHREPLIQITDRTYEWGFVGLGSFNDYGSFGRVVIEGEARMPAQLPAID